MNTMQDPEFYAAHARLIEAQAELRAMRPDEPTVAMLVYAGKLYFKAKALRRDYATAGNVIVPYRFLKG